MSFYIATPVGEINMNILPKLQRSAFVSFANSLVSISYEQPLTLQGRYCVRFPANNLITSRCVSTFIVMESPAPVTMQDFRRHHSCLRPSFYPASMQDTLRFHEYSKTGAPGGNYSCIHETHDRLCSRDDRRVWKVAINQIAVSQLSMKQAAVGLHLYSVQWRNQIRRAVIYSHRRSKVTLH